MAVHRPKWKFAVLDFTGNLKAIAIAVTRPADSKFRSPLLYRYRSRLAITIYQGTEEREIGTAMRHLLRA
jgi:hypothetical protein